MFDSRLFILQEDLTSLGQWEADWQMKFNVVKCHSMMMTVTPRDSYNAISTLERIPMNGKEMKTVETKCRFVSGSKPLCPCIPLDMRLYITLQAFFRFSCKFN